MSEPAHDPGGKTRLPLQDGVRGWVDFSVCGKYRHVLLRNWGAFGDPFVLWIGMNPSTADFNVDDPTIRKEMHFTRAMGFNSYVKVNVMDFRATDPKALLSVEPRSDKNLPRIISLSEGASRIICTWGALPKSLQRYADDVVHALRDHKLYCMGKTKNGSPRHPLYLRNDAECIPWP
jgi:hypothetical protein